MAKLVIVQVPARDGIPAHAEQMRPEDAARFWIAEEARFRERQERFASRAPQTKREVLPHDSGAVLVGQSPGMVLALGQLGLAMAQGNSEMLPFERTLIWDPVAPLRLAMVPHGLRFLDRWQIACPLYSYRLLARDIGTDEERERTARVIHELRVPVYDYRVLFVRRCAETLRFMGAFQEESDCGEDDLRLPFLRALYRVKPLMLALPQQWLGVER